MDETAQASSGAMAEVLAHDVLRGTALQRRWHSSGGVQASSSRQTLIIL